MSTSEPHAEHAAEAKELPRSEAHCAAFRAAIDFFRLDTSQRASAPDVTPTTRDEKRSAMDELIEICKVHLRRDSTRQVAILNDLRAAECVVAEWSKDALRKVACHVCVKFEDGLVLEGSFLIGGRARQPSLGQYLRDGLEEILATREHRAVLPGRGFLSIPASMAEPRQYERYALG